MIRFEIINRLKEYFSIYELVDSATYNVHSDRAWKFFDTNLLIALLIIREGTGRKMTVNNWKWNGTFSQRGLRTNICGIVKGKTLAERLYLSAHVMGKGIDFDVEGIDAESVRNWICEKEHIFGFKIRLEHFNSKTGKPIAWVHLDVFEEENNPKIYKFNV